MELRVRRLYALPVLAVLALVTACSGTDPAQDKEAVYSFQPGKWEVRTWMEINGDPGENPEELVQSRELTRELATKPVNELLFGLFYPGQSFANIVAEDGRISGSFDHKGMSPVPAHTSDVTGSYNDDEFRMVIDLPVMTSGMTQIVEGKLTQPLD